MQYGGGIKSIKSLLYLALGLLIFSFGCEQANNGKQGGTPQPSGEITITVKGYHGFQVKTHGTFKVKKNSTWQDIKYLAKSKITQKENKEIKEWRLKGINGKVLVDTDKFEKDEVVFAVSKDKDIPEPPTPPTNPITITIEIDEGYTFKEAGTPCTIEIAKGVK